MGKKIRGLAIGTKALNRRLMKLKRWADKAKGGSEKAKHVAAAERWRGVKQLGLLPRCCDKPPSRRCKRCPATAGAMIMAPLLPELPEPVPIIGDLIPHPEGGAYRERFRSTEMLAHPRGRGKRSALTLIHFCLQEGEVSAWHRVESDELWLYAGGDGVELLLWDGTGAPVRRRLGAEGRESQTWQAVPAGHWQAARPLGPRALLHCVVAPGFDFADFTLLRDGPQPLLEALQRLDPAAGKYL